MVRQSTIDIFNYVKEHEGENLTAADIAAALGLERKTVDGTVTLAFQRKGLMKRTPAQIQGEDGLYKNVKLISLTEEGKNWEPPKNEEK